MKPSANNLNEDHMDLLLFNYLEGELTEEQMAALEVKLAADPALQIELDYWKESHVEAESFDTSLLEKQLLKDDMLLVDTPLSYLLFILSLIILIPTLNQVAVSNNKPYEKAVLALHQPQGTPNILSEKEIKPVIPQISEALLASKKVNKASTVLKKQAIIQRQTAFEELAEVEMLPPVALAPLDLVFQASTVFVTVKAKNTTHKASLSRKQRRALIRHIEKARQQRQAEEFRKGNRPYVVPLDMKNF